MVCVNKGWLHDSQTTRLFSTSVSAVSPHFYKLNQKRRYSQNASVVLLLVHLVNYIFDEDAEVFHGMLVNNVTHIRYQNRLLNSVFKIHQKPKNVIIKKHEWVIWQKHVWRHYIWTDFNQTFNQELISVNIDIILPFTGFHDLLNVREEKMHVRLTESVE